MNEIVYYLIQNPLREENVLSYNRRKLEESLGKLTNGGEIRQIIHVPKIQVDVKSPLANLKRFLYGEYGRRYNYSIIKAMVSLGIGLSTSYILFESLFNLRFTPLLAYLSWIYGRVTPSIISGALREFIWVSYIMAGVGLALGLLPLLVTLPFFYRFFKSGWEGKRLLDALDELEKSGPNLVKDKGLTDFWRDSGLLIEETRRQIKRVEAEKRGRVEAYEELDKVLERLHSSAREHGLNEVNSYYRKLRGRLYSTYGKIRPKYWRNKFSDVRALRGIQGGRRIGLCIGTLLLVLILSSAILSRNIVYIRPNEAALIVEYNWRELFESWPDFVALITEKHSDGESRVITYNEPGFPFASGKLFWHLLWPLGKHQIISLHPYDYWLRLYLMPIRDMDGVPETVDPGIVTLTPDEMDEFKARYGREFEIRVLTLQVDGRYRIVNLEAYAQALSDSYFQDESIKEYGVLYEIVDWPPHGHEFVCYYLGELLKIYTDEEMVPELVKMAEEIFPGLSPVERVGIVTEFIKENPEALTEGLIDFVLDEETIERFGLDIEGEMGIYLFRDLTTKVYEESL